MDLGGFCFQVSICLQIYVYFFLINLAIWLLPVENGYGEWPASGEFDLVESRGKLITLMSGKYPKG